MTVDPAESQFEALCARIAAGEQVSEKDIPPEWRHREEVKRLLGLGRVMHGLALSTREPAGEDTQSIGASVSDSPRAEFGPWHLRRLLGVGGMGEVWLGERVDQTAHRVAIKRVRSADPAFATRLDIEKRILARLSHRNIARFIDTGFDAQGAPWLALEYVEGQNLNDWCEAARPDLQARLALFLKICAAVEHAHRHLVVHRDIKPGNVMVDSDGEPRLLDFGIAKLLDGEGNETTCAALTPAYAAPEQLRGQPVTTATDVYALGLLLYRLLAGALPSTRGNNIALVLERLNEEETQRLSLTAHAQQAQLPYQARMLEGDLDAIVSKAMRAAPEARFGSVAELAADLERHINGIPVHSRVPTLGYRLGRFVRRNRVSVAFAGLAAIGVTVGGAGAIWQAHRAEAAAALATSEATKARQEADTSERVTKFALKILSQFNPHGRTTTQPQSGAELIQGSIELAASDLREDPVAHARMLVKLAEIQSVVDSPDRAEATLRSAMALMSTSPDQPPSDLVTTRYALASVLIGQQRYLDAETELLALLPALASDPSLDRYHALSYSNLALIARLTGRLDLAVDRLALAHEKASVAYGEEHPNTIELLSNRGTLEYELDRLPAAAESTGRAIALFEANQGADFPRLMFPLLVRAWIHLRQGEHAAAKQNCLRGLDLAQRSFDASDPQVARFRLGCASILLSVGDWAATATFVDVDAGALAGRPELAFRSAYQRAELGLLRDELGVAQKELQAAQAVWEGATEALKNEEPSLTALTWLINHASGRNFAGPMELAPCAKEPVICAARAAALQAEDSPDAALAVFTSPNELGRAGKLDPSMMGAYQLLLARLAERAQHTDHAQRWRSMASENLRTNLVDSDWQRQH